MLVAGRIARRGALAFLRVLHTGIAWEAAVPGVRLPLRVTAWRRMRESQRTGVWRRCTGPARQAQPPAGAIDWSRPPSTHHLHGLGGGLTGASAVDRSRTGSRDDPFVDLSGHPARRRTDRRRPRRRHELMPLLEDLHARPIAGNVGRPRPAALVSAASNA
jgi:hypothetical protein